MELKKTTTCFLLIDLVSGNHNHQIKCRHISYGDHILESNNNCTSRGPWTEHARPPKHEDHKKTHYIINYMHKLHVCLSQSHFALYIVVPRIDIYSEYI